MRNQVKVTLMGANGSRTAEITPQPLPVRHIITAKVDPTPLPAITPHLPTPAPEPTPDPEVTTDLNGLLAHVDGILGITDEPVSKPEPIKQVTAGHFYPERHEKESELFDVNGRPIMAITNPSNFLECQELAAAPNDPRTWRGASTTAARRSSHHSESMDECRKWIVLAAHCLNKANRLAECEAETEPDEISEGQKIIVDSLSHTRSQTLDSIAKRTGLNALYIMLECRNLAEIGIVAIDSTSTVRKYRLEVC